MEVKESVLKGLAEYMNHALVIREEQNPFVSTCEFKGCERDATIEIETPDNAKFRDMQWTVSCKYHVGFMVAEFAAKSIERDMDSFYCATCETHAYCCECSDEDLNTKRKEEDDQISFNTCRICLCDMSEHNWEIHNAEMKAQSDG